MIALNETLFAQLVRTFFGGSTSSAIAALLDPGSTRITPAEYRRVSGLLKRARHERNEVE